MTHNFVEPPSAFETDSPPTKKIPRDTPTPAPCLARAGSGVRCVPSLRRRRKGRTIRNFGAPQGEWRRVCTPERATNTQPMLVRSPHALTARCLNHARTDGHARTDTYAHTQRRECRVSKLSLLSHRRKHTLNMHHAADGCGIAVCVCCVGRPCGKVSS